MERRLSKSSYQDVTILVSSCDRYADLWFPYFEIFKHQWPDCPYDIILNTESKSYSHKGLNIKCFQFYQAGAEVAWSDRLMRHLNNIDTEFVLFTLDDHFLLSPVNTEQFYEVISYLENNKKISALSFIPKCEKDTKEKRLGPFAKLPMNYYFRISCDTAIWRRKKLLEVLRSDENPWEFEINGTERALWDFSEYYGYIKDAPPILDVSLHLRRGYGLFQGKWVWANPELFQQFGINMDFSIRGYLDYEYCIKYLEKTNKSNLEFDKHVINHGNAIKYFIYQAKRRIPTNLRIFLSKVKRSLPIKWKDTNGPNN